MAVVNLKTRITDDWTDYNKHVTDASSKLYVEGTIILDNHGEQCLNFTVGDKYIVQGKPVAIPQKGIRIKAGESIVIETNQSIALPYNMLGIVVGLGTNIFRNGFVSSGKIDPGFNGKLKIAYYNGNSERITFKPGDVIAMASFFETESALPYPLHDYHSEPIPLLEEASFFRNVWKWFAKNWYSVLALVISISTLIVEITKG